MMNSVLAGLFLNKMNFFVKSTQNPHVAVSKILKKNNVTYMPAISYDELFSNLSREDAVMHPYYEIFKKKCKK